ncbi:MAG: SDR family oxidoreductase [Rikenellaceae bacterium]
MNLFEIKEMVVAITGGYGILGRSVAKYLALQGARIVIVGRNSAKGDALIQEIIQAGGDAFFACGDATRREDMEAVRDAIIAKYGRVDTLINAAGGNMPGATISPGANIFDLNLEDMSAVIDLNLMGTVIPSIVLGEVIAKSGRGSIINFSSMTAQSVVTRVVGYSAAKSSIDNFTRWMSVEMAQKFGEGVRVNAIAPGFFLTDQNRTLLTNPDGSYTPRAEDIVRNTPFGRMGRAEELHGAIHWLMSDAATFVTGTIIPIDGGFSIFSGV